MLAAALIALGACSSVKVPKSDLLEFPEMQSAADNISDYPKLTDVPKLPDDLRTASQWDAAAAEMLALNQSFHQEVDIANAPSDAEINNEINSLVSQVKAYKLDDPPE